MLILLASLIALGVVAALLSWIHHHQTGEEEEVVVADGDCASCNGTRDKCEQECMMEAATRPIEYFEDEELDRFAGRPSDSYTEEETELFAEVLETLKAEEIKAWSRSLILRGINMPDGIKDEFIQLVG